MNVCPVCNCQLPKGYVKCPSCPSVNRANQSLSTSTGSAPNLPINPSQSTTQIPSGKSAFAGFWERVGASLIDSLIQLLGQTAIILILGLMSTDWHSGVAIGSLIGSISILFYEAYFLSSERQATPGKMALKIVVTDEKNQRISFLRALGRSFLKIFNALTLGLGYLIVAFTSKKQGLHDLMIGTIVTRR